MKGRLRAPSPALVVSLFALFVALGGTSLAAANYINGKHIKPNSIPKNRLTKSAIKALHGQRGLQGPIGPMGLQGLQGLQGIQGQKGDTGSPGVSSWHTVLTVSADDSSAEKEADAFCPAGQQVISTDGQIFDNPGNDIALTALLTFLDGSGARADAQEVVPTASNWSVEVEAICAKVG